jgi:arginine metabolism regulation protein II
MHDALIVMFFRRVRPINPAVLQHYVESAADHLNEQEAVKGRTGINAPALLWPWFMVASEAIKETIRDKLRLWSSLARQYGGRNLEIAEQVVTEVWRRHDLELPNPTWVDVVREWGVTLVLT